LRRGVPLSHEWISCGLIIHRLLLHKRITTWVESVLLRGRGSILLKGVIVKRIIHRWWLSARTTHHKSIVWRCLERIIILLRGTSSIERIRFKTVLELIWLLIHLEVVTVIEIIVLWLHAHRWVVTIELITLRCSTIERIRLWSLKGKHWFISRWRLISWERVEVIACVHFECRRIITWLLCHWCLYNHTIIWVIILLRLNVYLERIRSRSWRYNCSWGFHYWWILSKKGIWSWRWKFSRGRIYRSCRWLIYWRRFQERIGLSICWSKKRIGRLRLCWVLFRLFWSASCSVYLSRGNGLI